MKPVSSASTHPPGAPRFAIGQIEWIEDVDGHLVGVDLDDALVRHAAGDWGESLYVTENERALATDRAVMSVYRTPEGTRYLIITVSGRSVTSVWPYEPFHDLPDRMLVDLVCTYVASGRADEVPDPPRDGLFCSVPLVGSGANPGLDEHAASMSLYGAITDGPHGSAPIKFEQKMWSVWSAVYGVDFRPLDANGQRVPAEASDTAWETAARRCVEAGIFAWFSVRWESRFVA